MIRTRFTRTLALAGFTHVGKPGSSLLWLACGLAALGMAQAQTPAATQIVLHAFKENAPLGAHPQAGLIADSEGNLYGTAIGGGTENNGVVFKLDATGRKTVLYSFKGGLSDAFQPNSSVTRDSAGNLYGTTLYGGPVDVGVVYKVDPARNETVLYGFMNGADGGEPTGGLILDSDGNLYGTANLGGTGSGVVYKVSPTGKETVLHTFTGGADGAGPNGPLLRDSAGNLYGTTSNGGTGANPRGVVYKLGPAGNETVLHNFAPDANGSQPAAGVIRDRVGNLYGTTESGGVSGYGVVFKLDKAGQETVLYNFTGGSDGGNPSSSLIVDSAGNLYGTTEYSGTAGYGVVYEVNPSGQEKVLYTFMGGTDGGNPVGGLIRNSAGTLVGATANGGASKQGAVYGLDTTGHETVLCSFPSPADGGEPSAAVMRDSAGNLFGTTLYGGKSDAGTVYKVDASGRETILYTFTGGADGANPFAGVITDGAGNLYGTTEFGGTWNAGTVYKLDSAGNETVLHSFAFFPFGDGALPFGGLVRDAEGNLYGTTIAAGTSFAGIVYKLDPAGNETVLYNFTGGTDGADPYSNLILGPDGGLYGTAYLGGGAGAGVVFKVDTAGVEKVLYSFTGGVDGANPFGGLVADSEGNLYGTTTGCGTSNCGVVFKLDTTGKETVLYSFTGGDDGGYPDAGVIRDPAGNLYGTTVSGGTANAGVVYRLNPAGQLKVLHNFTGGVDGGTPVAGVIGDAAGNLFGTAQYGGEKLGGVVFQLKPQ